MIATMQRVTVVLISVSLLALGHPEAATARGSEAEVSTVSSATSGTAVRVMYGPIVGRKARLPAGHGWGDNPKYGRPSRTGVETSQFSTMKEIRELAREHGVPWPTANTRRPSHNVYQIWGVRDNKKVVLFKYGITRASLGVKRPKNQIPACRRYMDDVIGDDTPQCDWAWLRKGTSNFAHGRRVEAAYITEYKIRTGECPPGARSCR